VRLAIIGLLCLLLAGCGGAASELEGAVRSAAEFHELAEPVVVEKYRAEQQACMAQPDHLVRECVNTVREKWAPVVEASTRFRQGWCLLDDAIGDARCRKP
jgi:hypothetical protein